MKDLLRQFSNIKILRVLNSQQLFSKTTTKQLDDEHRCVS